MRHRKLGDRNLITTEIVLSAFNRPSRPKKAQDTRAEALLAEIG